MTDFFIPYENDLFFLINGSHTPFVDSIMSLYSGRKIWIPAVLSIVVTIVYKKSWKEWLGLLLFFVLLFVLCDQISTNLIKPLVARPRPTSYPAIMDYVRTIDGRVKGGGGSYGFISWHTTNAFAFALFTSLVFRNKLYSWVIFIWAMIMAYSRIYLGVHFVSDILGGMIVGLGVGFVVYKLFVFTVRTISEKYNVIQLASYSYTRMRVCSLAIAAYIILFSLFSTFLVTFLK